MAIVNVPKGATIRTDSDGEYLHYHKVCTLCDVELTSRNRSADGCLRCRPCAAAKAREVWAARDKSDRPAPAPRKRKSSVSPERQAVHDLLTLFLVHPTVKERKDALLAALVDYEIKERFRSL